MSLSVKCPKCGTGLRVPDEAPGKKVRCAHCQEVFVVPKSEAAPATETPAEPWQRFASQVKIAPDLDDAAVRNKMRFQFIFKDKDEADRILGTLSSELLSALRRGDCWSRGLNKRGQYQLAWKNVGLSVGQGKDLLNRVVTAGGELYEVVLE